MKILCNYYEIELGGYAIEDDFYDTHFYLPNASIIIDSCRK